MFILFQMQQRKNFYNSLWIKYFAVLDVAKVNDQVIDKDKVWFHIHQPELCVVAAVLLGLSKAEIL